MELIDTRFSSLLAPRPYHPDVPSFLHHNPGLSVAAREAWRVAYEALPPATREQFDATRRHNLVVGPHNRALCAAGYAAMRVALPETRAWEELDPLDRYAYLRLAMAINEHVFVEGIDMTILRLGADMLRDDLRPPVFLFAVAGAALA